MKWLPGTGPSAQYHEISDDLRWIVNTVAGISTLAKLGGKYAELVCSGTQAECKAAAHENHARMVDA